MYFELYSSFSQWRWRLKAATHKIVADSAEGYHNEADAVHGINLVKGSSSAPIRRA